MKGPGELSDTGRSALVIGERSQPRSSRSPQSGALKSNISGNADSRTRFQERGRFQGHVNFYRTWTIEMAQLKKALFRVAFRKFLKGGREMILEQEGPLGNPNALQRALTLPHSFHSKWKIRQAHQVQNLLLQTFSLREFQSAGERKPGLGRTAVPSTALLSTCWT